MSGVSAGTVAMGMMGAGTGMSVMGGIQSGKSQKRLNEYNAQVATMQSEDAIARGKDAEERHRENVRRLMGSQRAAWAASGVDVNSGNAVDVVADTASMGELDALMIRHNAAREAWGFQNQAIDYRARGEIAEAEARNRGLQSALSTGSTLLSDRYGFSRR